MYRWFTRWFNSVVQPTPLPPISPEQSNDVYMLSFWDCNVSVVHSVVHPPRSPLYPLNNLMMSICYSFWDCNVSVVHSVVHPPRSPLYPLNNLMMSIRYSFWDCNVSVVHSVVHSPRSPRCPLNNLMTSICYHFEIVMYRWFTRWFTRPAPPNVPWTI